MKTWDFQHPKIFTASGTSKPCIKIIEDSSQEIHPKIMRRSIIPCIFARKQTLPFENIDTGTAYLYVFKNETQKLKQQQISKEQSKFMTVNVAKQLVESGILEILTTEA